MSSISFWVTESDPSSTNKSNARQGPSHPAPASSTVLDTLDFILTADLPIFTEKDIQLGDFIALPPSAGSGGHATVRVGQTKSGQAVAIKSSRTSALHDSLSSPGTPDNYLQHFKLEAQILSHNYIKEHRHIVDILGLFVNNSAAQASLSIVLPYSNLGSLDKFLNTTGPSLTTAKKIDLAIGVGRGLQALHAVLVCHGDVKIQNVLVFVEDGELIPKVSDFGESAIIIQNEPTPNLVRLPAGTPLLTAPELRRGATGNRLLHIDEATQADVYSFGLLLWEILKDGRSYFDTSWTGETDVNTPTMEFLDHLPEDALLKRGLEFIAALPSGAADLSIAAEALRGCLRDNARYRSTMSKIVGLLLQQPEIHHGGTSLDDVAPVMSWSCGRTLIQLLEHHKRSLGHRRSQQLLPFSLQQRLVRELQAVATSSTAAQETRAQAAKSLAECHAVAFGTENNESEVLRWMEVATAEGHIFASMWSERMRDALNHTSLDLNADASDTTSYLSKMICQNAANSVQRAREELERTVIFDLDQPVEITFVLFNESFTDTVEPLHMAAFLADKAQLVDLLGRATGTRLSTAGFNAVHYACLGGHISILQILLENGMDATCTGLYDITPLHLAAFFKPSDIIAAVEMLLNHGARADVRSDPVENTNFSMILEGVPLDWAVIMRNRVLVQALLSHTKKHVGIQMALFYFYWEIAQDLLEHQSAISELSPSLKTFRIKSSNLFLYWIAHGRHGPKAIQRTIECAHKYGVLDPNDALRRSIGTGSARDSLYIIESILRHCDSLDVKSAGSSGKGPHRPLLFAMSQTRQHPAWKRVVEQIVEHYNVVELQQDIAPPSGVSFLHYAAHTDSVLSAQVLLEKGVDPNQRMQDKSGAMLTPLHLCAFRGASTELWSILLDYGADINAEAGSFLPLEFLLFTKGTIQPDLLTLVLDKYGTEDTYPQMLHSILDMTLITGPGDRSRVHGPIRWALSREASVTYINTPDRAGRRMLEKAALYQRLDIVRLLLDAHADASIPVTMLNGHALLPLHITCVMSEILLTEPRGFHTLMDRISEDTPSDSDAETTKEVGQNILNVAMEFVDWHVAKGSRAFEGITRLHLASYMLLADEVSDLIDMGYDINAKATWPGIEGRVTPLELERSDRVHQEKQAMRSIIQTLRLDRKRWEWATAVLDTFDGAKKTGETSF